MIDAANPALHEAPESFNGISVNVPVHIDPLLVTDLKVPIHALPVGLTHRTKPFVARIFVGVHDSARNDVLGHNVHDLVCGESREDSRDDLATRSLDNADHGNLSLVSAHRATSSVFALSAVVGFIYLDRWPLQLQITVRHERADLLEHAPSGFVSDSGLALNLLCGNAATSRAHQVRSIEPQPKRSGGLLENSPRQWVDVAAAMIASIGSAASHAVVLPILLALFAIGHAARKAPFLDVFEARRVIRKLFVEVPNAVAKLFWYVLFDSHNENSLPNHLLVVKGYLPGRLSGNWLMRLNFLKLPRQSSVTIPRN